MSLFYRILADLIVVVHFAYMAFVVVGQLAILVGVLARWEWVRNFKFRVIHLLSILIVVLESWFGIVCPLTTWEQQLRTLAGEESYTGDFIATWVHDALFYEAEPWVFTTCYSVFGAIVLLTLVLAPPRRKKKVSAETQASSTDLD